MNVKSFFLKFWIDDISGDVIYHRVKEDDFRLSLCISEDRDSELMMRVTSTIFQKFYGP